MNLFFIISLSDTYLYGPYSVFTLTVKVTLNSEKILQVVEAELTLQLTLKSEAFLLAPLPQEPAVCNLWVAFSGGLDSSVLLHLLAFSRLRKYVNVVHVNHQLSPNSNAWQAHCEQFTAKFGIPYYQYPVDVEASGRGLENAAREARFGVFESLLRPHDVLLLAHHADDGLETLLYRLMRGCGLKGLAGMEHRRTLKEGVLLRPLMGVTRYELEEYGASHGLSWVEDESNADSKYDRNYLRTTVVPILKERWPKAAQKVQLTTEHLRSSVELMAEYGLADLQACDRRHERLGESIELKQFCSYSGRRQEHIIRTWVGSIGYLLPSRAHLSQLGQVIQAQDSSSPILAWGGCELRRYQGRLYLIPRNALCLNELHTLGCLEWKTSERSTLSLGGGWALELSDPGNADFGAVNLEVVSREGAKRGRDGEPLRSHPLERVHSQTLKKLLQEYQLEPWLRPLVPLIFWQGQMASVGDLWLCRLDTGQPNPRNHPLKPSSSEGFEEGGVPTIRWVFRKTE